jgi:phosphatidylglycerophosphate synthase
MSIPLTTPNVLSLSRLPLAAGVAWALLADRAVIGAALFALAVLTDIVDGRLARARGQATRLGTLLDHGADASFVTAVTTAAAVLGLLPWLLPPLIAVAFVQYLLDSHVLSGAALRRSRLGRHNGIAYYVIVGAVLTVRHLGSPPVLLEVINGCGLLLIASTLVSMIQRLRANA